MAAFSISVREFFNFILFLRDFSVLFCFKGIFHFREGKKILSSCGTAAEVLPPLCVNIVYSRFTFGELGRLVFDQL